MSDRGNVEANCGENEAQQFVKLIPDQFDELQSLTAPQREQHADGEQQRRQEPRAFESN